MGTHLHNHHRCDICDATYSRRYKLSAHKLKVHNIVTTTEYVKYVCDHCFYYTHHKGTFDRHYSRKHESAAINVHSEVNDSIPYPGLGLEPPASPDFQPPSESPVDQPVDQPSEQPYAVTETSMKKAEVESLPVSNSSPKVSADSAGRASHVSSVSVDAIMSSESPEDVTSLKQLSDDIGKLDGKFKCSYEYKY